METLLNKHNKELYRYAINNNLILSPDDKVKLLNLDKEYGDLYKEFWYKWDRTDSINIKEEFNKFIEAKKSGHKYFPYLKLVKDELDETWLDRALNLKNKFIEFKCFLSKYYIENIDFMYTQVDMTVHKDDPVKLNKYNNLMCENITLEQLDYAWDMIKKHPYKDILDDQPYNGNDIYNEMVSHMKKRKFNFTVKLNPYMVARQNVEPHNKTLHIKTDGNFNDLDVESLKIHEIDVHVARRYWGYKTGLNLFADGLLFRNTLDEGMAINQSLHHNKYGVKQNLEFDIAIKVIIGYYINKLDFCQIYDLLLPKITKDENKDIIEWVLFKNICRFKRVLWDCKKLGGDGKGETDYLLGYMMVRPTDDKFKQDIIHWNIGPDQILDLPKIKTFFVFNKFTSLM